MPLAVAGALSRARPGPRIGETLAIRRGLAEGEPEAFGQYVAGTLNNLGVLLRNDGDTEAARAARQEAEAILEPFAAKYPGAFAQWLEVIRRNLESLGEE